jgi:hypothetical protein
VTCPSCLGRDGGCPSCEGSGVVADTPVGVTFYEACVLVEQAGATGQPFHFWRGKPRLVDINGTRLKIVA